MTPRSLKAVPQNIAANVPAQQTVAATDPPALPFSTCLIETFNLSLPRVRPKECHAQQPRNGGCSRIKLALGERLPYCDQVCTTHSNQRDMIRSPLNSHCTFIYIYGCTLLYMYI